VIEMLSKGEEGKGCDNADRILSLDGAVHYHGNLVAQAAAVEQ
jgi:hypothetical protein